MVVAQRTRTIVNTSEGSKPANRVVTYANMWRGRGGRREPPVFSERTPLRAVRAWSMRMRQFHGSSLVKNNVIAD